MTKQFKDETREQQLKLFSAWLDGEEIEMLYCGEWEASSPTWSIEICYRIKSTADIVPWGAIYEDYQWYARDEDGMACVFVAKPNKSNSRWDRSTFWAISRRLVGHKIGTCHWKDSLQERPNS